MKRIVLVALGAVLLLAGAARAQDIVLLAILETSEEICYVDTLTVDDVPYLLDDFGGNMSTDTAIVDTLPEFPRRVIVSYTIDGIRMEPSEINPCDPDVRYPLGTTEMTWITFTRIEPGIEETGPAAMVRGLSVAPNPFSATTRLHWQLAAAGPVRAEVFDRSGRLARVLADARLDAGSHALSWDGSDARGDRVEPGVYFLRLSAGQDSRLLKVVLAP